MEWIYCRSIYLIFVCYNKLATSEYNRNKKLRLNKLYCAKNIAIEHFKDPQRHIYVFTLSPVEVWLLRPFVVAVENPHWRQYHGLLLQFINIKIWIGHVLFIALVWLCLWIGFIVFHSTINKIETSSDAIFTTVPSDWICPYDKPIR